MIEQLCRAVFHLQPHRIRTSYRTVSIQFFTIQLNSFQLTGDAQQREDHNDEASETVKGHCCHHFSYN